MSRSPRDDAEKRGGGTKRPVRGTVVHSLRVALFVAVLWFIHDAHHQRTQQSPPAGLSGVSADVVTQVFGEGARLDEETGAVLDAGGATVGRMLQTSPQADHIVGFSGPTNLLIALGVDETILNLRVLSSGDTREHVQQVLDAGFLQRFEGATIAELRTRPAIDAVSGATLTNLAMAEGLLHRLGMGVASLKFPLPPMLEEMRVLFPEAAKAIPAPSDGSWWDVIDQSGERIGSVLRSSPAADNIIGYQGPTDALVGFDTQGQVIGIVVGKSYDNDPYVDYVRDDDWFLNSFNGRTVEDLSELDLETAGVEGVSGATMTSRAVAEGLVVAAGRRKQRQAVGQSASTAPVQISIRNCGTLAVVALGVLIGMTNLRGKKWVRIPFQCVLIGYLGFVNGDLLSQAVIVGWTQSGIPWSAMLGMVLLTSAAFLIPITTKHNIYCHQLCPHGAAQQWLRPSAKRRVRMPRWLDSMLLLIPGGLLLLIVTVAMGGVSLSLVDLEPFDAYLITIAGAATITIAIVGLLASMFIPMAYCRYGCPTGAILEYVRRNARSDRLTARDAIATGCLLLAWFLHAG